MKRSRETKTKSALAELNKLRKKKGRSVSGEVTALMKRLKR